MLCMECGKPTASIIHLFNGGRVCPVCYVKYVDDDYEPCEFNDLDEEDYIYDDAQDS